MADGKVNKKLRREIMRRDRMTCRGCGLRGSEVRFPKGGYSYPTDLTRPVRGVAHRRTIYLSVDHIIPKSRGGTNDRSNLQILCIDCNSEKGVR